MIHTAFSTLLVVANVLAAAFPVAVYCLLASQLYDYYMTFPKSA